MMLASITSKETRRLDRISPNRISCDSEGQNEESRGSRG